MNEETVNKIARHDLIARTVGGFVLGILITIGGVIAIVICCINKKSDLVGMFVAMTVVAIVVAVICGIFLFKINNNKEETKEKP